VCGIAVLRFLASGRFTDGPPARDDRGRATAGTRIGPVPDPGRRLSLITLGFLAGGALTGVGGAVLTRMRASVSGDRSAFALPTAKAVAAPVPPAVQPAGVSLPTFITPSADFYRIDTALSVPQLSREDWRLRIHGMVDREVNLTFDDLEQFEVVEDVVTLACVSNPVGGDLISNAKWTGYRVRDLLERAGVQSDADMVLSKSIDGFTAGSPIEAMTDQRDSMLAIGMNDAPLPTEHGYPARLVVPGLYEVGRRPGTHPVRSGRGVLDEARLVRARADQDAVACRRAPQRAGRAARHRDVRRCRVGAEPRSEGRRGAGQGARR
jgi:DMSO/TMAO reductase YedYZ molybdopterin-dependent catalytic subunit